MILKNEKPQVDQRRISEEPCSRSEHLLSVKQRSPADRFPVVLPSACKPLLCMAPLANFSDTDFAFTCALARTMGGMPPALRLVGRR